MTIATDPERGGEKGALFADTDVEVRSVADWGRLVAADDSGIALPAFQRGTAWDERRVELLWDSLTRGLPIGALLFAKPSPAHPVRSKRLAETPMAATARLTAVTATLQLLDGQQRLTAIRIGSHPFEPRHTSRLWVDLAPPTPPAPRRGRFRLCSRAHPWGNGASLAKRRRARALIGRENEADDTETLLALSWPVDARVPVDAAALLARVLDSAAEQPVVWRDLLPAHFETDGLPDVDGPGGIEAVVEGLRLLSTYKLAGLLVRGLDDVATLGEAFARLNSQGVAMSQEELFFSALKVRWPESNDVVADIVEDSNAGRLLSATKIVHLATRIAVADSTDPPRDVDVLTLDRFAELENDPEIQLVETLRAVFSGAGLNKSRIHSALSCARTMLQYRRTSKHDDPGLPRTLLGRIHWRTWHALAAWADRHGFAPEAIDDESRQEALRYAVLMHFFVPIESQRVARLAFEGARNGSRDRFPGIEIAGALLREGLLEQAPPTPDEFRRLLRNESDDGRGRATWWLLTNEPDLLHWNQRRWLEHWYPDHDPTRYQTAEDLPFDADHIMPAHAFDGRGAIWCDAFSTDAAALRQSPGNLRLWPREANRSDQDASPQAKLFLDQDPDGPLGGEPLLSGWPCRLGSAGEVREASCIDEDQREAWRAACRATHLKDWSDPARANALRVVVDERRARLYQSIWSALGLGEWWACVRATV